jgi:hypothetical protein
LRTYSRWPALQHGQRRDSEDGDAAEQSLTVAPGMGGPLLRSWGFRLIERQELTGARSMIAPGVMPEPRL